MNKTRTATGKPEPIKISDVITSLREDLEESARTRTTEFDPLFEIGEVTIEVAVTVGREVGGEIGVRVWAPKIGAKTTLADEQVHTVTLKLQPVESGRKELLRGTPKRNKKRAR